MIFFKSSKTLSVVIGLSVALMGCEQQQPTKTEVVTPMVKLIDVGDISQGTIRQFPAEVEANTDSHLAFRVSGEIKTFAVKAGNRVTKGQLLAKLDTRDFDISLNDRKARYALALSQFKRTDELLKRKLVSQSRYDEANANLLVAKSNLNSAKTALEYTTLRAPYDGIIAKVYAEKHQNIQGQQLILDMQNVDSVDVSIQLPERLVPLLDKETSYQPEVSFDSIPDQRFKLTVKEWDTQANPITRTFKVVFTMDLPNGVNVLPGMSGTVYADLAKVSKTDYSAIVLPVAAVFSAEDKPANSSEKFVWQVDENLKVSRHAVTVGQLTEQGLVIKSGLNGDEIIVGAGVHYLKDGMTVRAWHRERGL